MLLHGVACERIFGGRARKRTPRVSAAKGRSVRNRHPPLPSLGISRSHSRTRAEFHPPPRTRTNAYLYSLAVAGRARHLGSPEKRKEIRPAKPVIVSDSDEGALQYNLYSISFLQQQQPYLLPYLDILDGLYGVQLGHRSPQAQIDDEAIQTSFTESSTCEPQKNGRTVTQQQRLLIRRMWQQRPSCLKPIHCSRTCGDKHAGETIANVLTSLPFIVLGLQTPRKNLNTALYANSLVGVGIASSLYHSSKGEVRKFLRWADYTMIATTTLCLSRAVRNENPGVLMAASTLLLPFQPLMVSALHTGMMEVSFANRASVEPELRVAHNLHKMSSLLGGALFIADDCFPETPYMHAAWHLAAAIGIGTCNKLLR